MLDIAEELHRWFTEGRDLAVATVVAVEGSAPRPPGAALAVDRAGEVIGSVSGAASRAPSTRCAGRPSKTAAPSASASATRAAATAMTPRVTTAIPSRSV